MSPEQRSQFIQQLLEGEPVAEIAKDLGISARTAWRWKADPEVAAELKERHTELVDAARFILLSAVEGAARTIRRAVNNEGDVTTAQYKAAYDLLTTHGLLGENARREAAPTVDEIRFTILTKDSEGNIVETETKPDPQSEAPSE